MDINLKEISFLKTINGNVLASDLSDGIGARVVAKVASHEVLNPPVEIVTTNI